jgi:hypothetical protein
MIDANTMMYLTMAGFGVVGQAIRGIGGLIKLRKEQGEKWKPDMVYFGLGLVGGGLVGVSVGTLWGTADPTVLIPMGFAGVDVMETILNNILDGIIGGIKSKINSKTLRKKN